MGRVEAEGEQGPGETQAGDTRVKICIRPNDQHHGDVFGFKQTGAA